MTDATVTRFEVIDENGRVYVKRPCGIRLSYQDDGRTLKVFVTAAPARPSPPSEPTDLRDRDVLLSQLHAAQLLLRNGDHADAQAELSKAITALEASPDPPKGEDVRVHVPTKQVMVYPAVVTMQPAKPRPFTEGEASPEPPKGERCEGRYPVGHRREEPFEVTYRCGLSVGHLGPHRAEPIAPEADDRPEPIGELAIYKKALESIAANSCCDRCQEAALVAKSALGEASPAVPAQPDYKALYHELLYAVGNKYPGESRHETALRYIRRAETQTGGAVVSQGAPKGILQPCEHRWVTAWERHERVGRICWQCGLKQAAGTFEAGARPPAPTEE